MHRIYPGKYSKRTVTASAESTWRTEACFSLHTQSYFLVVFLNNVHVPSIKINTTSMLRLREIFTEGLADAKKPKTH